MPITPEMCVSGRDITEPRPSPGGDQVATVVRFGGAAALVVVPLEGGPERVLTTLPAPSPGRGLGGGCFDWLPGTGASGSAEGVVYTSGGALWHQPLRSGATRRVVDHGPDASVRAPSVAPDGRRVSYVVDEGQVWSAPLDAGSLPVRIDDGSADFCADPHDDGSSVRWQAWSVPDMPWDAAHVEIAQLGPEGEVTGRDRRRGRGAIQQPRVLPDGRPIEVRDDDGWLNVWLDGEPLVSEPHEHAGPSWGPGQRSFAVSPDGSSVAFTRNEAGFGRLCVVDVASGTVRDVGRGVHGQLGWAGESLVALRTGARTPTQVVTYRPTSSSVGTAGAWERRTLLVGPVAAWDTLTPDELPEPEAVQIDVDGIAVHARRYRTGARRTGTLCWIHGGPTDQWQVEFMPRVAYWVAQGWDVIAPDPRGSTGHGRSYQQALRQEWGRLDVDDTAAVLRHAHRQGWSDPATTVLMGGSSGGLTVLGVLAMHPGLVAGGVAMYPVTDLAELSARSHRFEAHYTLSLVGPLDDTSTYEQRSPVSYADRIDVPLLVMHGDADPVVPVEQSVRLAERVRTAGGDVELHVVEGEGHGFRLPENKLAEYSRVASFLRRVVSPVGH